LTSMLSKLSLGVMNSSSPITRRSSLPETPKMIDAYSDEPFSDERVTYTLQVGDRFFVIENVPARVSQRTGSGSSLRKPSSESRPSSGGRVRRCGSSKRPSFNSLHE
jgi:hypothetical protein